MTYLRSKYFWRHTFERAVKTLAQAGIGVLVGETVVDWNIEGVLVVLFVPPAVSVLTSIASGASNRGGGVGDPSIV